MTSGKRIASAFIVLAVVAAGFAAWRFKANGDGKDTQKYRTEKIDRGDVATTVTATGTLSAVTTVQIGSQVSGVISRLEADFNSRVQKGQLLAALDPAPFEAQVEQRRAEFTRASVELRNADIQLRRQRELAAAGLAPQADLDGALATYDGARTQVQQTTAALSQSETNLRYTRILSPVDGVVVDRQYDIGQTVAATFQAPTLFTIAQDLEKMQVQADVDQSDIGRIKLGQTVRFTVDAYPEDEFEGKVSQIRLNATVNQNVVSYPVIIEVDNPEERLRPNMTANVTVEVARKADVLRIPNAALRFRPPESDDKPGGGSSAAGGGGSQTAGGPGAVSGGPRVGQGQGGRGQNGFSGASRSMDQATGRKPKRGGTSTVQKLEGTTLVPVTIRTGISDGRFTEIRSEELKEGDVVVIGLATAKVDGAGGRQGGPRMGRF